jgi:predicted nucleic acid-binding protein
MNVEYQFVDTNVLVYAYDKSDEEKRLRAADLITTLWEYRLGCLSIQTLQEFYVTMTRKIREPLSSAAAEEILVDLSSWQIHRPTVTDMQAAIALQRNYQISFWDAMILQSAHALKCTVVWSEDLGDGQIYGGVRVRNPFNAHAA